MTSTDELERLHTIWQMGSDDAAADASNDIMEALPELLARPLRWKLADAISFAVSGAYGHASDYLVEADAALSVIAALTPPADDHPLSGVTHAMWSEMVRTSNEPPADDEVVAIRQRRVEAEAK